CFFFSSRRRHTRSKRDWSSDVCSSDLNGSLAKPITIGFRGLDLVMTINPILFYLYYETPEGMLAAIRQMCYHVLFGHIVEYDWRSEEHTSELQSRFDLVCRLLLEKKSK